MSGAGALRPLIARSTWRRWAYLIAGGALLMPYWFLGVVVVSSSPWSGGSGNDLLAGTIMLLVLPALGVFVTGLVPAVRVLEGTAVRELVGGPLAGRTVGPARTWQTRWRTACWYSGHLWLGVLVGFLSLAVPPLAAVLTLFPFFELGQQQGGLLYGLRRSGLAPLAPPLGLLLLAGLGYLIAGAGALTARLAPVLLGPSSAERLAELEEHADRLAERNRLARELHDSVGHALSIVTLQAGAAGRVMDTDPEFARQALAAIEESARGALADLDHVLGLLREEAATRAPQRTLADLAGLIEQARLAGVTLEAEVGEGLDRVPAAVSREAYRIVQEGLTNAVRHAGRVPVTLSVALGGDRLEVEVANPLGAVPSGRPTGGRGLRGIAERVTVLGGRVTTGPDGRCWRVSVSLPLRSTP